MKEYWQNVYYYCQMNEYLVGNTHFQSRAAAMRYMPSFGLRVAYRIHVRMK